jgi:hypothetical protein
MSKAFRYGRAIPRVDLLETVYKSAYLAALKGEDYVIRRGPKADLAKEAYQDAGRFGLVISGEVCEANWRGKTDTALASKNRSGSLVGWRRPAAILAFGALTLAATRAAEIVVPAAAQTSAASSTLSWIRHNCSGGFVNAFPGPGRVFRLSPNVMHKIANIDFAMPPARQLARLSAIDPALERALAQSYKQVDINMETAGHNPAPVQYPPREEASLSRLQFDILNLGAEGSRQLASGLTELSGGGGPIKDGEIQVFPNPQVCSNV